MVEFQLSVLLSLKARFFRARDLLFDAFAASFE